MSHTTEDVKRYVCMNCNSVLAGDVAGGSGESHRFSAPDKCAACGNDEIVRMGDYPHEAE